MKVAFVGLLPFVNPVHVADRLTCFSGRALPAAVQTARPGVIMTQRKARSGRRGTRRTSKKNVKKDQAGYLQPGHI